MGAVGEPGLDAVRPGENRSHADAGEDEGVVALVRVDGLAVHGGVLEGRPGREDLPATGS